MIMLFLILLFSLETLTLWDEVRDGESPYKHTLYTPGPTARTGCPCSKVTSAWSNCDFNLDSQWGVRSLQRVGTLATVHSPHHYSDCSLNLPAITGGQVITELPDRTPWALVGETYGQRVHRSEGEGAWLKNKAKSIRHIISRISLNCGQAGFVLAWKLLRVSECEIALWVMSSEDTEPLLC